MSDRAACVRCAAGLFFSRFKCFAALYISVASVVFRFCDAPLCVTGSLLDVFAFGHFASLLLLLLLSFSIPCALFVFLLR